MFAENPNSRYCPVKCLAGYLNMRPKLGKWFFLTGEESPVTRVFVASALDRLTKFAGLDPESFGTHSIRAGRASDMAAAGVPSAQIQATGRWSSEAYRGYLRFRVLPDVVGGVGGAGPLRVP